MTDDTHSLGSALAQAATDTIYTVQAGDSLSKIALHFYGDGRRYPDIAARNNIARDAIVYIGQRLIIPAARRTGEDVYPDNAVPASPGGSVPMAYGNEVIETVTTTAPRIKNEFWKDWRFWAVAGGAVALIWFVNRNSRR